MFRKIISLAQMMVLVMSGLALPFGSAMAAAKATHAETIDGVLAQLLDYYTFPEVAEAMASDVRARQAAGEYRGLAEGPEIAERLTRDLYAISGDDHIQVRYSEQEIPEQPDEQSGEVPGDEEIHAQMTTVFGAENYGSERVEVLPGNIGYYKLTMLIDPYFGRERHGAAMSLLAGTEALILDFRDNRGAVGLGSVEAFASYFFDKPTHLFDMYWREFDRTDRIETHDNLAGPKYLGRPIYLLTSRRTFSGGEAVASQLQTYGRATIVGERSGGGANPGQPRRASAHYTVWVPNGMITNAITGGNWEGTGVTPDVVVPAQKALLNAQALALDSLLAAASDDIGRARLGEAKAAISRKLGEFRDVEFVLDGHSEAKEVRVAADFNHWEGASFPLSREGDRWIGHAELIPGSYLYRFEVDSEAMPDPANPTQERIGRRLNSVRVVK